jgi:TolA-binding protein
MSGPPDPPRPEARQLKDRLREAELRRREAEVDRLREETRRAKLEADSLERREHRSWFQSRRALQAIVAGLVAVPLIWFYVREIAIPMMQRENLQLGVQLEEAKKKHLEEVRKLASEKGDLANQALVELNDVRTKRAALEADKASLVARYDGLLKGGQLATAERERLQQDKRRLSEELAQEKSKIAVLDATIRKAREHSEAGGPAEAQERSASAVLDAQIQKWREQQASGHNPPREWPPIAAPSRSSLPAMFRRKPLAPMLPPRTLPCIGAWAGVASESLECGRARLLRGEYGEAAKALESASRPGTELDVLSEARYWLGEVYYHLGRLEEADWLFRQVAQENPRAEWRLWALHSSGWTALALGDLRRANGVFESLAKNALVSDQIRRWSLHGLALTFYLASDYKGALAVWEGVSTQGLPEDVVAEIATFRRESASRASK